MPSPGPPPPPSPLCPATNTIVALTSSHLPLSPSFGNWDEGGEGGSFATTLSSVQPQPLPPQPLSPCFDPRPSTNFATFSGRINSPPHNSTDNDFCFPFTLTPPPLSLTPLTTSLSHSIIPLHPLSLSSNSCIPSPLSLLAIFHSLFLISPISLLTLIYPLTLFSYLTHLHCWK